MDPCSASPRIATPGPQGALVILGKGATGATRTFSWDLLKKHGVKSVEIQDFSQSQVRSRDLILKMVKSTNSFFENVWIHLKNLCIWLSWMLQHSQHCVSTNGAAVFSRRCPVQIWVVSPWVVLQENLLPQQRRRRGFVSHPEKRRSRFCCPKCFQSSRVFRSYLFSISRLLLVCLNATLHLQSWVYIIQIQTLQNQLAIFHVGKPS